MILVIPEVLRSKLGSDGAEALVDVINKAVDGAKGQINSLVEHSIEHKEQKLVERLSAMESRLIEKISQLDARVSQLDARVSQLEARFPQFEARILWKMVGLIASSTAITVAVLSLLIMMK